MDISFWMEAVSRLATPGIAAVSAFYVYCQYARAQRWKAADLATAQLAKLESDDALSLACHALDWGIGPLLIPKRYQPLFPRDETGAHPEVMQHDANVMVLALKPLLSEATLKDPKGLVYRFCFIKLFDYIENVSSLIESGQIEKGDIGDLRYWLRMINHYKYAPAPLDGREIFQPVLKHWGYEGVYRLSKALGVSTN